MRLYLDTEFNGFGGELISMAVVGEDVSWYEARIISTPTDAWVFDHVIPVLDSVPLPDKMFRAQFHAFIKQFFNPEIICDWHADAVHFCQMLQGPSYGTSLDFGCRLTILKTPHGFTAPSAKPHNALADAIGLMEWHNKQAA